MLKSIHRGALALCAASFTLSGAASTAGAADLAGSAHHVRHGHRVGCGGAFWPDYRCYYGIPAYPYSHNYRCRGLHEKALETGSPVWWRRYRACLG